MSHWKDHVLSQSMFHEMSQGFQTLLTCLDRSIPITLVTSLPRKHFKYWGHAGQSGTCPVKMSPWKNNRNPKMKCHLRGFNSLALFHGGYILNQVVVSNMFYVHPLLTNIFQMGWFNYQPVNIFSQHFSQVHPPHPLPPCHHATMVGKDITVTLPSAENFLISLDNVTVTGASQAREIIKKHGARWAQSHPWDWHIYPP